MKTLFLLPFLILQSFFGQGQGELQFKEMGDFQLESGLHIKNCRIGYRTFGKLNPDRSNVVVLLPWFSGASSDFAFAVGPDGLVDSFQYHVIIIDPLGDGISSSPSNSREQPNDRFPEFTVRDMVNVQQVLLKDSLSIQHVQAIAGFSMGGMECFQWAISYPGFMKKIIPISGAAKPTPYDKLFYQTIITAAESGMNDSLDARKARQTIGLLFALHVRSMDYIQQLTPDSLFFEYSNGWTNGFSNASLYDFAWQMKAILHNDVFAGQAIPEEEVIKSVKPQMLIIVNVYDRVVNPHSSYAFAKNSSAGLMELKSGFGHLSLFGEFDVIAQRVRGFLKP